VQPATAGSAVVIEATTDTAPVRAMATAIAKMILRMNGSLAYAHSTVALRVDLVQPTGLERLSRRILAQAK